MTNPPSSELLGALATRLGTKGFTTDADTIAPWLEDWRGRFHGAVPAMLSPANRDEVAFIVKSCADARVALVPQGGNSSMVGGATPAPDGRSLLLSLRRMNAIRAISADDNLAICEAGVVLSDLHDATADVGRRFPLSLGAKGSATIGGLVSTNAGGTQVLCFGAMRGLVRGIEAVLPDGSLFDGLAPLKKDNRGYDLRQLLVGAEGTLGVVTAASLTLVPAIGARAVAWVGLGSPTAALDLLRTSEARMNGAIESFELVPAAALDLVLRHVHGTRAPLAGRHEWHVLVEATAPLDAPGPADALGETLGKALEQGLVEDAAIATSEARAEDFWRIRDSISEAERKDGPASKHDLSVEVSKMPAFMTDAAEAVEARFPGTRVIAFGHLGDGNVHFNVRAPAGADTDWIWEEGAAVTAFVHDLTVAAGGSISAEHGIGQMRLGELARTGDRTRLAAMRAIKAALDPHGIMNPGKLVPPCDGPQDRLAKAPHQP